MGRTIPMGRTRPVEHPWLTITDGEWTWRVLKAYSADPDKPYARWLCDVTSPYTYGGSDLGDTYTADIVAGGGYIVQRDPEVPDEAIPVRLRSRTASRVERVGYITVVEV